MAPKKSNKNAEMKNLSKSKNIQSKHNSGKSDQSISETEPESAVQVDGNVTSLRRSTRKQICNIDPVAGSSKQINDEKSATKRPAESTIGNEPKRKAVAQNLSVKGMKSSGKKRAISKSKRSKTCDVDDESNSLTRSDSDKGVHHVDKCNINQLPSEILTEILANLPFPDFKSARLVCRRWFEASNVMQFSYEEKLLCYALYDTNVILRTLMNSQRKVLNLEFYDINFGNSSKSSQFWIKCGPRIESLLFSDCVLSDETMKNVIKYCDKLKCLSLENMSARSDGQKVCSNQCLNELVDSQIRRESLYFLEVDINETGWISNNFLRALFTIFPNIRQFSFYCDTVEDDFSIDDISNDALLQSTEKCTFNSILKKLIDSQAVLDSLMLDVGDYQTLDFLPASQICSAISPLNFPELRDIKIDIELFGQQQLTILEFFSRHKQLQSVECQIFCENSTADFIEELLNCLLGSCPDLQCLHILEDVYSHYTMIMETSVFTKLAKSKLDSLTFNFGLEIPHDVKIVNNNLRSLCILAPGVEEHIFNGFCRTFRGLTHLEMVNANDKCLQDIIKYHPNLMSLKLIDCQGTDYGFTGCQENHRVGESIKKLTKLEYLELKMWANISKITEATVLELQFPELLYLHITIEAPCELCKRLVQSFANFSQLEGLACYFEEIVEYSVWLELCSKLKNLRYLHVQFQKFKNFGDKKYKQLFNHCPSLRALHHRSSLSSRSVSYYYDVVSKKAVKKTSEREYRISSEQIDTFSVNWMWF